VNAQEIGVTFRQRREQLRLSQADAGRRASPALMRKTVADIENATGNPLLASVIAYAAALGLSVQVPARRNRK